MLGGSTPNIDRIANEGAMFTDYYGEQSCTAGRSAFITGQHPLRTGLLKVGMPGADIGLRPEDPTIAELLKPHGYTSGQFGKNHLGDRWKIVVLTEWRKIVLSIEPNDVPIDKKVLPIELEMANVIAPV